MDPPLFSQLTEACQDLYRRSEAVPETMGAISKPRRHRIRQRQAELIGYRRDRDVKLRMAGRGIVGRKSPA
jgi:hypothetical protein